MVDLHGQYLKIKEEVDASIQNVLDESMFINGGPVKQFSSELADYLGVKHVIPCGNGTDAIMIALMALGLEKGDEVIVPAHTYVATAEVAALLGLKLVFVDVDSVSFCIDVNQVADAITSKTKVIVPVHLYGQCANMDEVMSIADKNGLFVIEDTAQALGATYAGDSGDIKMAGAISHIGTTSFFPSKTLGCFGDGGAMMTSDDELAKRCRMVANHGQSQKYVHDIVGCNSRLDTIQAGVLRVKLKQLDGYNQARKKRAVIYDVAFENVDFLKPPVVSSKSTHVYHQYTLVCQENRDELKAKLLEKGVPSMVYYPIPLHLQKAYDYLGYRSGDLPITERLADTVLSLPVHTELSSEHQEYIIQSVVESISEL